MFNRHDAFVWQQLHWQRPVTAYGVTELLRLWASDPRQPLLVLEARSSGRGVQFFLGVSRDSLSYLRHQLRHVIRGTQLTDPIQGHRPALSASGTLRLSRSQRPLSTTDPEAIVRAILAALVRVHKGEEIALQIVLGPRRIAQVVSNTSSVANELPFLLTLPTPQDGEARSALRDKRSEPAFRATIRVGATAATRPRRRALLAGLLNALRMAQSPGVSIRLLPDLPSRLHRGSSPWRWPLTLNVAELTGLLGWPVGETDLPGVPALHPVLLPPESTASRRAPERVVALSTAPGQERPIGPSVAASLHHTWVVGPTGSGKSTLLANLIVQDIKAGRSVVVIEPKGDLVDDVLARIPKSREADVVVLDPTDPAPVGCNPLAGRASAEVRADALLSVFRSLFADSWGPRTQDIVHACLLTLARHDEASLPMVPLLLTNSIFRKPVTRKVAAADPIALGPFWAWYEALSDAERGAAIAPVMNKLRAFLLDPRIRGVLGQTNPRFDMAQVFSDRKILLVPLRRGTLGQTSAQLLGSLIVAQLWQASQARAGLPASRRAPVMVYIDEVQDYLHLPTELADSLAQARGLGVGFTLAHQYLGQLPRELRAGLLSNVRSRVCFQLGHDDAAVMAKGHPELAADDFGALEAFRVYASLLAHGRGSRYVSGRTLPLDPATSDPQAIHRLSSEGYGTPRGDIERTITDLATTEAAAHGSTSTGRRRRQP